jgi:hypothetical protein
MVATGFGLDDKVSKSGDSMQGTLAFEANPPFTVPKSGSAPAVGTVTLDGTSAVSVATEAAASGSVILLTVQPGTAPVGIPYIASVTDGTGFTVKSTSSSDTAVTCAWLIVQGA